MKVCHFYFRHYVVVGNQDYFGTSFEILYICIIIWVLVLTFTPALVAQSFRLRTPVLVFPVWVPPVAWYFNKVKNNLNFEYVCDIAKQKRQIYIYKNFFNFFFPLIKLWKKEKFEAHLGTFDPCEEDWWYTYVLTIDGWKLSGERK